MNGRLYLFAAAFIIFTLPVALFANDAEQSAGTYWDASNRGTQEKAPSSEKLSGTSSIKSFKRRAEIFENFADDEIYLGDEIYFGAGLAAVVEDVAEKKSAFIEFASDTETPIALKTAQELVFLTLVHGFTSESLHKRGVEYEGAPFLFFLFGGKKSAKLSQQQIEIWARHYLKDEVKILTFHDEDLAFGLVGYVVAGEGGYKSGAIDVDAVQNDAEELERNWRPSNNIRNNGLYRAIVVAGGDEDPREKKPVASDKRDRRIIAAERVCFLASLALPEHCNELRRKARINTLNKKIKYK